MVILLQESLTFRLYKPDGSFQSFLSRIRSRRSLTVWRNPRSRSANDPAKREGFNIAMWPTQWILAMLGLLLVSSSTGELALRM